MSILRQTPSGTSFTVLAFPMYLLYSGGALAAFGVGVYYFLIPKMGVGPMMSYAWFDMPVKQIDFIKLVGILALIAGVILINIEK